MPKVRKKYNKIKQLTRVADHLTRSVVIAYTDHLGGCYMVDLKHSRIVPPESKEGKQVLASLCRPHVWSCYIAVFGRNKLGDQYMKSEQLFTNSRMYQEDLAPTFEEHHGKLIETINKDDLCAVGWLASPHNKEFTEQEAENIFDQLGVWK